MSAESIEQPYWYAVQTRSRHEKVVRDQLYEGITICYLCGGSAVSGKIVSSSLMSRSAVISLSILLCKIEFQCWKL